MSTVLEQRSLPRRRGAPACPGSRSRRASLPSTSPRSSALAHALARRGLRARPDHPRGRSLFLALAERARARGGGAPGGAAVGGLLLVGGSRALSASANPSRSRSSRRRRIIPVIAGAVLVLGGVPALRAPRVSDPLPRLPHPAARASSLEIGDGAAQAIRVGVVAAILLGAGLRRGARGVVLDVGGHQMLVADACSGMNSIVSLAALTLLYTHLTGPSRPRALRLVLLASVVPDRHRRQRRCACSRWCSSPTTSATTRPRARCTPPPGLLVFVVAFLLLAGLDSLVRTHAVAAPRGRRRGRADCSPSCTADRSTSCRIVVAALMIGCGPRCAAR